VTTVKTSVKSIVKVLDILESPKNIPMGQQNCPSKLPTYN